MGDVDSDIAASHGVVVGSGGQWWAAVDGECGPRGRQHRCRPTIPFLSLHTRRRRDEG